MKAGTVVLMLLWGSAALGAEPPPPEEDKDGLAVTSATYANCLLMSRIFFKLGEQRDAGASAKSAAPRVNRWLREVGKTGSNLAADYRGLIGAVSVFVYKHPEMNPIALSSYGYRSCEMNELLANDVARQQAGLAQLYDATIACQRDNPGDDYNQALPACVRIASRDIVRRVRQAPAAAQARQ